MRILGKPLFNMRIRKVPAAYKNSRGTTAARRALLVSRRAASFFFSFRQGRSGPIPEKKKDAPLASGASSFGDRLRPSLAAFSS